MNEPAMKETVSSKALTAEELKLAQLIVSSLNLEMQAAEIDPSAPLYGEGMGLDSIDILEVALAISKASYTWSKWPCVMSITSHFSTFFKFSGVTGLFMTQGSTRISLDLALRTFQVPWPSQVKLTSAFSAMREPPRQEREVDATS